MFTIKVTSEGKDPKKIGSYCEIHCPQGYVYDADFTYSQSFRPRFLKGNKIGAYLFLSIDGLVMRAYLNRELFHKFYNKICKELKIKKCDFSYVAVYIEGNANEP
jgi:hypothetical protein